jgi:hypothetical protein
MAGSAFTGRLRRAPMAGSAFTGRLRRAPMAGSAFTGRLRGRAPIAPFPGPGGRVLGGSGVVHLGES